MKNRSKKKRKFSKRKMGIILGVIIFVFCISIAYAALSTSLKIIGTADIDENTWYMSIDVSKVVTSAGQYHTMTPSVDGHLLKLVNLYMNVPGDYAEVEVSINNEGTLYAELNEIITGSPVCSSETGNKSDEDLVCDNLNVSIQYKDGNKVEKGDIYYPWIYNGSPTGFTQVCKSNDFIENTMNLTNANRAIIIRVEFSKDVNAVPSSKVVVSNIDFNFDFIQSDNVCPFEL